MICPLCIRELPKSEESRHHLIPKSKGGAKGTITVMHRVCHAKIHSAISEDDLARNYNTIESLRQHPEIVKFLKWISKKSPDFYDRSIKSYRR